MGMTAATPQKFVAGFMWTGIKNLNFYSKEFEEVLI